MTLSTRSNPDQPVIVITPAGLRNNSSLRTIISTLTHEFVKAYRLVLIDFRAQSFGLYLGHLWLLLEPALQAGAYYFLLSIVFRMQGADATFAFFFIGITFWRSHSTLVTSAPYFLTSKGYTNIEQGLGLLPAVLETLISEMLLLLVRLLVLAGFLLVIGTAPRVIWLLIPLVVCVQFLFSMSLFLLLSMLGAVYKDVGKLVGHAVWLWWYLSPGLYSLGRIPDWAMVIYAANPFAYLMPSYHEMILKGVWSETNMLGCLLVAVLSVSTLIFANRLMYRFSYRLVHYV